jgi:hypothetical protein
MPGRRHEPAVAVRPRRRSRPAPVTLLRAEGQQLGVASLRSCRLSMDASRARTLGGANRYPTGVDSFDEQGRTLGLSLSTLAAVVVDASRREVQIHATLQSPTVIGESAGMPQPLWLARGAG